MTSISPAAGSAALTILNNLKQAKARAGVGQAPAMAISSLVSGAGRAEKSVSSAIFNAVTNTAEKDDTIKAVLTFIDRDYTNIEEKFPSLVALYAERPETQDAVARVKEVGAKLKEQVLADPEGVKKMIEQIKVSRPTMSMDGVIGIMIAELGQRNGHAASVDAASQVRGSDPAEATMDVIGRIQSEMRFYHTALANKAVADTVAMTEQSSITHISRYLADGMDPGEASARYEAERAKGFELSDGAKLGEQSRNLIDGIEGRIKTLTEKLSKVATIEGDILAKQPDGTYDLGTFSVRDKSGDVSFSADANGQVTYKSPRYNASYYGRLL